MAKPKTNTRAYKSQVDGTTSEHASAESVELAFINPTLIRRVQTKLAKIIYIQSGGQTIQKRQCKSIAYRVEEILKGQSSSEDDYRSKAVNLVQNLGKRKTRVKTEIFIHLEEEDDQNLMSSINKLISG